MAESEDRDVLELSSLEGLPDIPEGAVLEGPSPAEVERVARERMFYRCVAAILAMLLLDLVLLLGFQAGWF